ncbi:Di-copper centre-containing protein [Trametopsis cervina]|nr:Di-copper centre-containing protein [Trametopsis cervina]
MANHYEIVGFPGHVEVRHDVQHLMDREPDVWNIYILALDRIMSMNEQDLTSYFQLAGIHGLPYTPWDDVGSQTNAGYCAHATVLFPTWHRVYMLLFEQVLRNEAVDIANQYTDRGLKTTYGDAALKFRLPYWDWAASSDIPLVFFKQTITVRSPPLGTETQIDNPLYTYRFQRDTASYRFSHPFTVWTETIRHPPNPCSPGIRDKTQSDLLKNHFHAQSRQLRTQVYNLLMFTKTWEEMSNTVMVEDGNSLEGVHNTVHNVLGNGGHVSSVPVAAFDPIFWYHHVNVDRLLALWQAMNPDSKVPRGPGPYEGSELEPFHFSNEAFWTSHRTYDGRAVGNRYPEYPAGDVSPDELKEIVRDHVEKLYGPEFLRDPKFKIPGATPFAASTADDSEQAPLTKDYRDWVVNVSINTSEYPRSGYVHVFLCHEELKGKPTDWLAQRDEVGVVAIFKNESKLCGNCNRLSAANVKIHGQVFLTEDLVDKQVDINDVEVVRQYLKAGLRWRCALVDGTEIPLEDVPSLAVKVQSAKVHTGGAMRSGGGAQPWRDEYETFDSVTHGKVGGYAA